MGQALAESIQAANAMLLVEGKLEAVSDFFTSDYLVHLTGSNLNGGHDIVRQVIGSLRHSFTDLSVEIEILVEAENRIAWQRTMKGIHARSFKGFPATNRQIVWRDMVISKFYDELIAEEWVVTDLAERLLLARKR